jgi:hypothetical protein
VDDKDRWEPSEIKLMKAVLTSSVSRKLKESLLICSSSGILPQKDFKLLISILQWVPWGNSCLLGLQLLCFVTVENISLPLNYQPPRPIIWSPGIWWLYHLNIDEDDLRLLVGDFDFYRYEENRNKPRGNFN